MHQRINEMEGGLSHMRFLIISYIFLVQFSLLSAAVGSNSLSFSAELIPRDSPISPFYNASETHFDRLQRASRHSVDRARFFRANGVSTNAVQSIVKPNGGSYLMNISLGSPPVSMMGIADTGSDLIWRQCQPCSKCYRQIEPIFDPSNSNTYKTLSCEGRACSYLRGDQGSCGGSDGDTCTYLYRYGDHSHTFGDLAIDTLTIGSTTGRPVQLEKVIFGCGYDNGGSFEKHGSGLIGLGGGPLSLISQLRPLIGGRFSYCLLPLSSDQTSKLNFGKGSIVSGAGTVSTPLVSKDSATFFYLTLEGISVGTKKVAYTPSGAAGVDAAEGNIVIDSGTTLTLLPRGFFKTLVSNVRDAIRGTPVEYSIEPFGLCYDSLEGLSIPTLTAHFAEADVVLQPLNTFAEIREGLYCFTMVASDDFAIFGNLAQMNFLVGYDLISKQVSFKPADCTKH